MRDCARVGLVAAAIAAGACGGTTRTNASPDGGANVLVIDITQGDVDKVDLLVMVDNSVSMADKQNMLAEAVPQLVERLITPRIIDGQSEFRPVTDIHIGVITSSLGGHGGDQCSQASGSSFNPTQDDSAHLIPSVRQGLASYDDGGEFLWWDPTQKANPPGQADANTLISDFQAYVQAAGEQGCGYEAQLESWYRFLVDPNPPAKVELTDPSLYAVVEGPDQVVLQQRNDFLRPDSLVAIIMLSDENDCSIIDGGYNWLAAHTIDGGAPFHLPRATTECNLDPNHPCCQSCASTAPNAGCPALGSDANCQQNGGYWDDVGDHPNLRCWQQQRRFGLSFLYPTRRYVEGLTQPRICPDTSWVLGSPCADDERVVNPLFFGAEGGSRHRNSIYLAGIVGVPWQDIATDATLGDATNLLYLTASELTASGRWDWLVPKCAKTAGSDLPLPISVCDQWDLSDEPDDPLMIESTDPRTGTNPAIGAPLVDPSGGKLANPINGHEWNTATTGVPSDLQYACVFELPEPKPAGTDCQDALSDPPPDNPLCQSGGSYSTTQTYAKGYPGQRELEVLKDFGNNSIVASICPKITDPGSPSYGYNPAVDAIIERLGEALPRKCTDPGIEVNAKCQVVEVTSMSWSCSPCNPALGRSEVDPALVGPVLSEMQADARCGPESISARPCTADNYCMCTINRASNPADCLNDDAPAAANFGWCYLDADGKQGNPDLVAGCSPPRSVRFVGEDTPTKGSFAFLVCPSAT